MKLSVTIPAINEEENLPRCIESVRGLADEVIVGVDDATTDNSAKVAKKLGAKVVSYEHLANFHINKKKLNALASGEWILQLDADEALTPELKKEIKKVLDSTTSENGFWLPRANFFLGKFLKKGGVYPDYTLRLYRRGLGDLPGEGVHEQARVEGQVGYLKHDLLHYANPDFGRYIEHFNRYTDIWAQTVTGGFWANFLWKPLFDSNQGFLSIYVRHLGFLDGFPGFVWALFSSLNFPVAYLKSLEKKYGSLGNAVNK